MPVFCEVRPDGIAIVTLNNPPLNVVFRQLTCALDQTLDRLEDDDYVRAVILTGAGQAFCAGSDIREFQPLMQPGRIGPEKLQLQHKVFSRLANFPKPTLAAVHGVAFGGGLEIAVCCDFIVADPAARFALPEIKLGVFPGSGGPVRITHRVGVGRAKELMLLGDPIDADTALTWGLINRISDAGASLDHAITLAQTLCVRLRLPWRCAKKPSHIPGRNPARKLSIVHFPSPSGFLHRPNHVKEYAHFWPRRHLIF